MAANRLDQTKVAELVEGLSLVVEKTAQERDEALAKLARYENREKAEKLANATFEKGLSTMPRGELVDKLAKLASENPNEFAAQERAVEMVGANMFGKFAAESRHDDGPRANSGQASADAFNNWVTNTDE